VLPILALVAAAAVCHPRILRAKQSGQTGTAAKWFAVLVTALLAVTVLLFVVGQLRRV
jgi:hypothetical protein